MVLSCICMHACLLRSTHEDAEYRASGAARPGRGRISDLAS